MYPVWEKQLGNKFILVEYPKTSNQPYCSIVCADEFTSDRDRNISVFFQTWGVDREQITKSQCSVVFQVILELKIVDEMSGFSFKEVLDWASD
jgi:hypothetical protein